MRNTRLPAAIVVAAGVSAALHVGKLPPAIPVLRDALGVTLVEAGFLLSLVQLAGMLLGLAVGLLADSAGLRRSVLAGLIMLALASGLGGFVQDASQLLVLRALEGVGLLLAAMPAPGLIRRLVPPGQVDAALGWWGAYMPLGTALALLCGPLVMEQLGWPGWWWMLGGCRWPRRWLCGAWCRRIRRRRQRRAPQAGCSDCTARSLRPGPGWWR